MSSIAAHAFTIVGMEGDGTSIGTTMIFHDTATGYMDRMPFAMLAIWMAKSQIQFSDSDQVSELPNSQLFFF